MPMARTLALRLTVFTLLWWVLTEGQPESWPLGSIVILSTTALSLALSRPAPWSAVGFLRFVPFFLWRSLHGGADVAWRACMPGLPIAPGMMIYRLRLPPGRARIFMTAVVSLVPGTLSAELARNNLYIHSLDMRASGEADLAILEAKVAALFRIRLPAPQITDAETS
jgi:multicomponent Na+:H+ antiporter subunit E